VSTHVCLSDNARKRHNSQNRRHALRKVKKCCRWKSSGLFYQSLQLMTSMCMCIREIRDVKRLHAIVVVTAHAHGDVFWTYCWRFGTDCRRFGVIRRPVPKSSATHRSSGVPMTVLLFLSPMFMKMPKEREKGNSHNVFCSPIFAMISFLCRITAFVLFPAKKES